jgi:predicted TPR repeat methyltransferase
MKIFNKNTGNKLLKNAYTLKTPEDSIRYYKSFSKTYDSTFAKGLDYIYPKRIAEEFYNHYSGNGDVCDIGCGTGLVGKELRAIYPNLIIDGIDISTHMIEVAKNKNIYRKFYNIDLTKPIKNVSNNYSALISAGTFTHGHLGPKAIINLLSICKKDALLTIGINALHYRDQSFDLALHKLERIGSIKIVKVSSKPIYGLEDKSMLSENQFGVVCTFVKVKN